MPSDSERPDRPRQGSWGHSLLLLAIGAATAWYLYDVIHRSRHFESTFLVRILAPVVLIFVAVELVRELNLLRKAPPPGPFPWEPLSLRVAVLMALFVLYIVTLPWLGLDVGSFVYIVASLAVQRVWTPLSWLVAAGVAFVCAFALERILPYDVPLLLL